MTDEFNKGQILVLTATLEDPANNNALTDDATESFTVTREDGTLVTTSAVQHPGTGIYTTQVTADEPGWWHVIDGQGGSYTFWVKPTVP